MWGKKSVVEIWGAEDNKQDLKRGKDRAWDSVSKQGRGFKPVSLYFARWWSTVVCPPTLRGLKQSRAFPGAPAALSPRGLPRPAEKEQSPAGTARLPLAAEGWEGAGCGLWPGASRGASPAKSTRAPLSAISGFVWGSIAVTRACS